MWNLHSLTPEPKGPLLQLHAVDDSIFSMSSGALSQSETISTERNI